MRLCYDLSSLFQSAMPSSPETKLAAIDCLSCSSSTSMMLGPPYGRRWRCCSCFQAGCDLRELSGCVSVVYVSYETTKCRQYVPYRC